MQKIHDEQNITKFYIKIGFNREGIWVGKVEILFILTTKSVEPPPLVPFKFVPEGKVPHFPHTSPSLLDY